MTKEQFIEWLSKEEDISAIYKNGIIYTISESDSNKYIDALFNFAKGFENQFGKLPYKFYEGYIYYMLPTEKYLEIVNEIAKQQLAGKIVETILVNKALLKIRI